MDHTLAERLAQARRELGVRLWRDVRRAEIAKAAKVDPSMVTLYEQGNSVPSEDVLGRLAAFFGVTPAYLRYGVQPSPEPYHVPVKIIEPLDAEEVLRQDAKEKAARAKGGQHKGKRAG